MERAPATRRLLRLRGTLRHVAEERQVCQRSFLSLAQANHHCTGVRPCHSRGGMCVGRNRHRTPPHAGCGLHHMKAVYRNVHCGRPAGVAMQWQGLKRARSRGMDRRNTWYGLVVLGVAAYLVLWFVPDALAQEPIVVGRIAYTEGQILRFVPETQDWVATVQDTPFGMNDALYSEPQARAEVTIPNGLRIRIGASTQIQPIALKNDAADIDLASGVARFDNLSTHGVI